MWSGEERTTKPTGVRKKDTIGSGVGHGCVSLVQQGVTNKLVVVEVPTLPGERTIIWVLNYNCHCHH